ncbi:MAG: helix-turn-helix transcriptional regulator [Pseudomonadota bacterium]
MDINNIGKRVVNIRKKRNLNQKGLAELIDVSSSYLAVIEKGKKKPSFNFIVSVLSTTKVNADWLFTGRGSMYLPIKKEKEEIREINENRVTSGADNSLGLDDVLDILKSHWDKLSDDQEKVLVGVVKEMVKNNNEILLEENRKLKDFIIEMMTNQPGEIPSNVVQGLTD